jgi:hypothetical protein
MGYGGRYAKPQKGMKTGSRIGDIVTVPPAKEAGYGLALDAVRECGPDAFWGQKSEAPTARREARQGKTDYHFSVLRPAAEGAI